MAERLVSPGVFTQERDLSFLVEGISGIGGAFIGPTPKGPAFIPTVVNSSGDYAKQFGEADGNSYMGYTVKNYLQQAAQAVVVRVLGLNGYTGTSARPAFLYATGSNGKKLYAVLHPTAGTALTSASVTAATGSFVLTISSSTGVGYVSPSLSTADTSTNYFANYLGSNPRSSTVPAYVYALFPEAIADAGTDVSMSISLGTLNGGACTELNFSGSQYTNAFTPWIQSQTVGGVKYSLFRIHTISDGVAANGDIKTSIVAIKPNVLDADNDYGTFSIIVRRFNDTDVRPEVVEQWDNLDLNPDSPDYIARRIGSSAPVVDEDTGETYYSGDFRNNSKYIRIEMSEPAPVNALPYGFAALSAPVNIDSGELTSPTFITSRWLSGSVAGYNTSATDQKYYYGFDFDVTNETNRSYLAPLPSGSVSVGSAFNIEDLAAEVPLGVAPFSESISLTNSAHLKYRRFTVPFQGGFDGMNPSRLLNMGADITSTNTQGFDLSTSVSDGSVAYLRALDAVRNPEAIDINLLVLPGVNYEQHSYVSTEALTLCEDRQDAFFLMDLTQYNASVDTVVNKAVEVNTTYAASYFPWVKIIDTNTNKYVWAPPSVVLPEVFAYSDNVSAEWFAPAGLNRGGIEGAVGVAKRLSVQNRDELYENRVNPIAAFPGQGIVVWGQKTLQHQKSALDRVNVRRLLITVKKFIASTSRYLVFEQNVEATRNRFLNIVNPYLSSIQERSGLYAFKVIMDESNNTPDVIDRNILVGQIYLQPTKTAEFIVLEFNVLPTGAVFPGA